MDPFRRLRWGGTAVALVLVGGTVGYVLLGFGVLDALYQTVTTITTVGFREVEPLSDAGQVFTMFVIVGGVGTALYTFSVLLETFMEGRFREARLRRRMERRIADLHDHVVICGWGRVGKAIARYVEGAGSVPVIVDKDPARVDGIDHLYLVGDATDDSTLRAAGIERARALVAAINTDAENLYVTLSGRDLRPELFIVARAREEASEAKLLRAGADRVVNPQAIGGARMAAFVVQPRVAEFLDVVMHDGSLEFRLDEVKVDDDSPLVGRTLREARIREQTGALILALLGAGGEFLTNPSADTTIEPGQTLIAIGTSRQLTDLDEISGRR